MTAATAVDVPAVHLGRPVYTRLATLGLVLAGLAPLAVAAAGLLLGFGSDDIAFFIVGAAVPLIGAALVWRFGAWAKILGLVLSVLVALAFFWMAFGLTLPASILDFVPGVLILVGVPLALTGNAAALVQGRRGHLAVAPTRGERRTTAVVLGIVALATVASVVLSVTSRTSVEAAAGATEVTFSDFAFDQMTYEATAGEPVEFVVHNADPVAHTFTIEAFGVDEMILPGNDAQVSFTPDEAGTYVIYCIPHASGPDADPHDEHEMAATLVVK